MKFELKIKKSGGVYVTPTVHRIIRHGNHARDAGKWTEAIREYRQALKLDPSLYHIWIQYGHVAHSAGFEDEADAAYMQAAKLRPNTGEPHLHMGHWATKNGKIPKALNAYAIAENYADTRPDSLIAIRHRLPPTLAMSSEEVAETLRKATIRQHYYHNTPEELRTAAAQLEKLKDLFKSRQDQKSDEIVSLIDDIAPQLTDIKPDESKPGSDYRVVFDITDLIMHFRGDHRFPTGIQRVQVEVVIAGLRTYGTGQFDLCCFVPGREKWVQIHIDNFIELAYMSGSIENISEAEWQQARKELLIHLVSSEYYEVPEKTVLVNLGTSWFIYNYFLLVRNYKERGNFYYIPFVHDLIPVITPEYCAGGVVGDYITWVVGVYQHADFFLANSESTAVDLIRTAKKLGRDLNPENVVVVPLDADFRRPLQDEISTSLLHHWNLKEDSFALFVSTIEPRKNHLLAFEGWIELIHRHGKDAVPQLVCMGRKGWLYDRIDERLESSPELKEKITFISRTSDDELALLYRSCMFTVYPSHYEGWGLPITESLCYGKIPVIADNSSLPEAGAGFSLIFESNNLDAFVGCLEKVIFDSDWRKQQEKNISTNFRPRTWAQIADQINTTSINVSKLVKASKEIPRKVELGKYYPVSLYKKPQIWPSLESGEIFRLGFDWLWPETDRCRIGPNGGTLCITDLPIGKNLRMYIQVSGLTEKSCPFSISIDGDVILRSILERHTTRWILLDIPERKTPLLKVFIKGEQTEMWRMHPCGVEQTLPYALSVVGFAICDADDEDMRISFLESATAGNLEEISIYREPAA
ncbi:glycosyltransferase [Komagataeibacter sp. FNDCR1]|nr:glycosyltransferase [Komagataeibacter sp. FNDCR1]